MTRELVKRAMHGDSEAFELLAAQSLNRLVGTAGLILRDADAAQDVVQESLIRAWQDLPRLRDPARFDSWLYRILLNRCTDHGRDQNRRRQQAIASPRDGTTSDHSDQVVRRHAIASALDGLSDEHRVVVVLRYYLDLSQADIARVIGEPIGTVKSRLSRALTYLRADIAATERSPEINHDA
jgi:RNA polymerase sigma-70 factor (ECF subfamily)